MKTRTTMGGRIRSALYMPRTMRRAMLATLCLLTLLGIAIVPVGGRVAEAAPTSGPDRIFFGETGHYLAYGFLTFWRHNGAYAAYGAPISEEMTENGRTVQYFQRARFEYHSELKGTAWETSLGLLGVETLQLRGHPATSGNPWTPIGPVANTVNQTYFMQTHHSMNGAFKAFWDKGGLFRYGYPISQPYSTVVGSQSVTAQDFERVRMIQDASGVWLLNLGIGVAQSKGVATGALPQNPSVPAYSAAMFEHWVDVNLSTQSETFYEGQWPVRTSLIASGMPGHETPTGTFHINRRVYNETMTGGTPGAEDYYYLTNVLYTQYFTYQGHALHYAWWRSTFGTTGSHGCVNEDLATARFAWDWLDIGSRVVIHY